MGFIEAVLCHNNSTSIIKDASRIGSIGESYAKFLLEYNGYKVSQPPFEGRGYDLLAWDNDISETKALRVQVKSTTKKRKNYRYSSYRHNSNHPYDKGINKIVKEKTFDLLVKVTPVGVFLETYESLDKKMQNKNSCIISQNHKIGPGVDLTKSFGRPVFDE